MRVNYVVGYLPCVWSAPGASVSCLARCVRELSAAAAAAAELWGRSLDVDDTQPPIGHHQYRLFVCLSAGRLTASAYSCPASRRHPHLPMTLIFYTSLWCHFADSLQHLRCLLSSSTCTHAVLQQLSLCLSLLRTTSRVLATSNNTL